jgi:L-alanine-DL-glutamate epimerase-like enolase superfamily enzyme
MPKVTEIQVCAVDLPLRAPFRHAAATRFSSDSVFVRIRLDNGVNGWGECLPRAYVTGETSQRAVVLLRDHIAPALLGQRFTATTDVVAFLAECDGKAPSAWVPPTCPQHAAWCAVDLALLDAFARADDQSLTSALVGWPTAPGPPRVRYSGVASGDRGPRSIPSLLKLRAFGLRHVKLKLDGQDPLGAARRARRILGSGVDLRVDANMAWPAAQVAGLVAELASAGIQWFEQPVAADDLDAMAALVDQSGAAIVADESLTDRASLQTLLARRACTGVNVRLSKCGGLVAASARSHEALDAGLDLQIGCHVGESSLLSAAQLTLLTALESRCLDVRYAEGCFGRRLLPNDPASPSLQFHYGGRAPTPPSGPGFGVHVDQGAMTQWIVTTATLN